jgi:hypothetical protein
VLTLLLLRSLVGVAGSQLMVKVDAGGTATPSSIDCCWLHGGYMKAEMEQGLTGFHR